MADTYEVATGWSRRDQRDAHRPASNGPRRGALIGTIAIAAGLALVIALLGLARVRDDHSSADRRELQTLLKQGHLTTTSAITAGVSKPAGDDCTSYATVLVTSPDADSALTAIQPAGTSIPKPWRLLAKPEGDGAVRLLLTRSLGSGALPALDLRCHRGGPPS